MTIAAARVSTIAQWLSEDRSVVAGLLVDSEGPRRWSQAR